MVAIVYTTSCIPENSLGIININWGVPSMIYFLAVLAMRQRNVALTCYCPFSLIFKMIWMVQIRRKVSKNAKVSQKYSKLGFATRYFAVALQLLELSLVHRNLSLKFWWKLGQVIYCCCYWNCFSFVVVVVVINVVVVDPEPWL